MGTRDSLRADRGLPGRQHHGDQERGGPELPRLTPSDKPDVEKPDVAEVVSPAPVVDPTLDVSTSQESETEHE